MQRTEPAQRCGLRVENCKLRFRIGQLTRDRVSFNEAKIRTQGNVKVRRTALFTARSWARIRTVNAKKHLRKGRNLDRSS